MSSGLPVSFTIVMVFVFMIIGFFVGRYVSLMVYKRKFAEKEEYLRSTLTAPVVEQSAPAPLADPAKFTELLRLYREKQSGAIHVETSGHLLATAAPLNPAQKKRFIDLLKELAVWIGIPASEIIPAPAEPVSKPAPVPPGTVPPVTSASSDTPRMASAATPVKTDPMPIPVPQPPTPAPSVTSTPVPPVPVSTVGVQSSVPPVPYAVTTAAPKVAAETAKKPAVSMVEQIDEILQEIIQRSENPNRRIKLVEERNQGVIVWVDQEHFSGIDAVTNDSARELIRAAAKEWERRAEAHL